MTPVRPSIPASALSGSNRPGEPDVHGGGQSTAFTYGYLTSVEHSGSTLCACLLSGHPSVSTVGEYTTPFDAGRCSCGVPYAACPFWNEWGRHAAAIGEPFETGHLDINLAPGTNGGVAERLFFHEFERSAVNRARDALFGSRSRMRQRSDLVARRSVRLARLLCSLQGGHVFFDTSKNPFQIRFLSQVPDLDLRVVALVRDGRAVMKSLIEKEKYSPERAVSAWVWGNTNIERVLRYMKSENVFRLKMEDLCARANDVVPDLLRFLGAAPGMALDYSDRSRRHIVGNDSRHRFDGTVHASDESWRRWLTTDHLSLFERRAGALNRRYGYS